MKGKPEDYIGYDEYLSNKCNMTIEKMYGEHPTFKDRNLGLVKFVMKDKPSSIFEFACTYDFLAIEIIRKLPDIKYVCTNFLPEVIEYIRKKKKVKAFVYDANDIPYTDLKKWDAFICTSLEHLENDIELLNSLPTCTIYFCATNMYDKTHFWTFKDELEIYDRYKNVMRIIDYKIFKFDDRMKIIGRGKHD